MEAQPPPYYPNYESFFDKKFQIGRRGDEFELPGGEALFQGPLYEIPELQVLKASLNATKNKLNDLPLTHWHAHTKEMNPAGYLRTYVQANYRPEFSTQAWLKLTEILASYQVIPKLYETMYKHGFYKNKEEASRYGIHSVHLCEAPGAFISALNHWLKTKYPGIDWTYSATTLNPYYEGNSTDFMINEDRLILNSYANWFWGKDNTGNLMDKENIQDLLDKIPNNVISRQVFLVTADGSIDCQSEPDEQESIVSRLHLAETVAGLLALERNGTFILKIFTFFECYTVGLLYLLSAIFDEVHLNKPITSKEGNSEVYVICVGYKGLDFDNGSFRGVLETLLSQFESGLESGSQPGNNALFSLDQIPVEFMKRIVEAAGLFVTTQVETIERNLDAFKNTQTFREIIYDMIHPLKLQICTKYDKLCGIKKLKASDTIFKGSAGTAGASLKKQPKHVNTRNESGTWTERYNRAQEGASSRASLDEIVKDLWVQLRPLLLKERDELMASRIAAFIPIDTQKFVHGKRYTNIHSSRFSPSLPFEIRQKLRDAFKNESDHVKNQMMRDTGAHLWCRNFLSLKELFKNLLQYQTSTGTRFSRLYSMCFRESLALICSTTDLEITVGNLTKLASVLLGITPIQKDDFLCYGNSLFLCKFPMVTRLHVGMILGIIKVLFREAHLFYDLDTEYHGVFLKSYMGKPAVGTQLHSFLTAIKDMEMGTDSPILLEVLPLHEHIYASIETSKNIFAYNSVALSNAVGSLLHEALPFHVHHDYFFPDYFKNSGPKRKPTTYCPF